MPELLKLTKLLLVIPATNTTPEQSFSEMKHIKTFSQLLKQDQTSVHAPSIFEKKMTSPV